jgi:E-phenylitaconyl-CoA hydratase
MTRDSEHIDLDGPLPGLRYKRSDGIATITLDRPRRGNSLAPGMQKIFRAIWADVRENDAIRVAIVKSTGEKHFCTGFDLGHADGQPGAHTDGEEAGEVFVDKPFAESVHWSPHQNQVWKPVICVVGGLCVGGGLHFVVDADIVIASENAAFTDTHVNVGMVGAIENIGLAKRLPLGAALRMTLMGRHYRMPARRAYELGLVDELLPTPADAEAAAQEMAVAMLENSPQAMAASKKAIWRSLENGYTDSLEEGWSLLRAHWNHPDFSEGPRAFANKRAPNWNPDPDARNEEKD